MARIIPFPLATRGIPPSAHGEQAASVDHAGDTLPATSGRRCEYAVGDLARLLGLRHFTSRTVIAYLRAKARDEGMPLPKTPRLRNGVLVAGPESIWLHSRWDAERFDGWKARADGDDPVPPVSAALRSELASLAEAIATPARRRFAGAGS